MRMLEVAIANKRVVLIDDEAYVGEVVPAWFQDLGGWDVLAVASDREGLDQAVAIQSDAAGVVTTSTGEPTISHFEPILIDFTNAQNSCH